MFKSLLFSPRRRLQCRRGYTLIEMMVALISGSTIVGSILVTTTTLSNTMVAIANYDNLDKCSRNTLDTMSRDLRNTAVVTLLNSNQVTATNVVTGDTITYSWDGTNALTRTFDGTATIMLTGCDALVFSGFQRNPTNNFQFVPAQTAAETKLISVSWRCSRQIFGAKQNTESVQTAQICIRN